MISLVNKIIIDFQDFLISNDKTQSSIISLLNLLMINIMLILIFNNINDFKRTLTISQSQSRSRIASHCCSLTKTRAISVKASQILTTNLRIVILENSIKSRKKSIKLTRMLLSIKSIKLNLTKTMSLVKTIISKIMMISLINLSKSITRFLRSSHFIVAIKENFLLIISFMSMFANVERF